MPPQLFLKIRWWSAFSGIGKSPSISSFPVFKEMYQGEKKARRALSFRCSHSSPSPAQKSTWRLDKAITANWFRKTTSLRGAAKQAITISRVCRHYRNCRWKLRRHIHHTLVMIGIYSFTLSLSAPCYLPLLSLSLCSLLPSPPLSLSVLLGCYWLVIKYIIGLKARH